MALEPPYDRLVLAAREGKEDHELIQVAGLDAYRRAQLAAGSIPDSDDLGTYLNLLKRTAAITKAGEKLKRASDRMLRGEEVDIASVMETINNLDMDSYDWITMDEVEAETNVWIPTYWPAWDDNFGGIPKDGLIIVAGPPGTGKTSLVAKLMDGMTRFKKKVGFLSLEMRKEIVKMRWLDINPNLTRKQARRMRISDLDYSLDEACASIARLVSVEPDIYAIFIDYADLMVILESTEAASQIYIKLAKLAKKIGKPIFLLAQLSRNYVGGIPHVTDIRWSGLAEAAAVMICLLVNPDQLFVDVGQGKKESKLPYVEGKAYVIEGKSRYGFLMGSVGAIQVDWTGEGGWGEDGDWYRL